MFSVFILLACSAAMLFKVITASSVYERILALNVFNTCMVVSIVVLGFALNAVEFFIDVSLMYACVGLVAAVGFAKFFICNDIRRQ